MNPFEIRAQLLDMSKQYLDKQFEINTEFANIQVAVNSKSDTASPIFTGTVTIPTLAVSANGTVGGTLTVTGALEAASVDGGTF